MNKAMVVFNSYETMKKHFGKKVFVVISLEHGKDKFEYFSSEYGELRPYESRPKGEWIEIKYRKPTEEERERHPEAEEWFDCELPEHGEEVLVTTAYNNLIAMTTFANYGDDGCEFEDYDAEDIIAWCRLPEPYIADMRGDE